MSECSGIAVLTGAMRRSSSRSLVDRCAVSGRIPGSGAKRQGQVLDEVSTAILGGAAAENKGICAKDSRTDSRAYARGGNLGVPATVAGAFL